MKLEQQVCSLELSKRLKELGVKQDGYYSYFLHITNDKGDALTSLARNTKHQRAMSSDFCSAFTVAELYDLLYSCGICDILVTVEPTLLADHLATILCTKLENK